METVGKRPEPWLRKPKLRSVIYTGFAGNQCARLRVIMIKNRKKKSVKRIHFFILSSPYLGLCFEILHKPARKNPTMTPAQRHARNDIGHPFFSLIENSPIFNPTFQWPFWLSFGLAPIK